MIFTHKQAQCLLGLIAVILTLMACRQTLNSSPNPPDTPAAETVPSPVPGDQAANEAAAGEPGFELPHDEAQAGSESQSEADLSGGQFGEGWQRLDTTGGGGQTGIAVHPDDPYTVYMASDNGGLFKTENGGDTWYSVSNNLGAYRLGYVTLDPLNPDVVYVAASTDYGSLTDGGRTGEIHRSLDGGQTWQFVTDGMGFQNSFPNQISIAIPTDPNNPARFDQNKNHLSDVIVVGGWTGSSDKPVGGVWRSEDEGESFSQIALKDKNVMVLRNFAGDGNLLFLATYEGEIYRSEDLGETWQDISGNMPLQHPSDLVIHPTNPDILYVTCRWCASNTPPVWKTTDGGQTWQAAAQGLDPEAVKSFPRILMDRSDPDTLYVTTHQASFETAGIYQTTDGGQQWELMPYRLELPDGRPYYWLKFDNNLTIGQGIDGRLYAGGGGGWRYPDGNPLDGVEEWEPATLGIGNVQVNTVEIDPDNPEIVYQGIADFGPYKSTDQGETFSRILGDGWPVTVNNFEWTGPYYSNYTICQFNCSNSCNQTGALVFGGTNDFAISNQNSDVVYSAFGSGSNQNEFGGVNKSTDGGRTWQPLGFQAEGGFALNPTTCVPYGFRRLAIDPTNDQVVLAAMAVPSPRQGILYKTTDGGLTWTQTFSATSFITGLEISPLNPDRVVLTTMWNVFHSTAGGAAGSWQDITPPNADLIQTVAVSPHDEQVYVIGTNDQGLFYTADAGETWQNNPLKELAEQKLRQGSKQSLDSRQAADLNPAANVLKNVSAIVFDPVVDDTFYIGGTRYTRASYGVAKITEAGQRWQHLPLKGLTHRNIFDLTVDTSGKYLYAGTFDGTFKLKLR